MVYARRSFKRRSYGKRKMSFRRSVFKKQRFVKRKFSRTYKGKRRFAKVARVSKATYKAKKGEFFRYKAVGQVSYAKQVVGTDKLCVDAVKALTKGDMASLQPLSYVFDRKDVVDHCGGFARVKVTAFRMTVELQNTDTVPISFIGYIDYNGKYKFSEATRAAHFMNIKDSVPYAQVITVLPGKTHRVTLKSKVYGGYMDIPSPVSRDSLGQMLGQRKYPWSVVVGLTKPLTLVIKSVTWLKFKNKAVNQTTVVMTKQTGVDNNELAGPVYEGVPAEQSILNELAKLSKEPIAKRPDQAVQMEA